MQKDFWQRLWRKYKRKEALTELELQMEKIKMEKIKNLGIALLSEKQASVVLGVSYNKLRYLRRDGKISFCKLGHSIKYRISDLRRYIERSAIAESIAIS